MLKARPATIAFEGANPRHEHEWAVFEDVQLPDGKCIAPGMIDSTTNFIEQARRPAHRALCGRRRARECHRRR